MDDSRTGRGDTSVPASVEPSRMIRGLGWLEIALGVVLVGGVTVHHLRDDSGTAAILWLYSFPAAFLFLIAPGAMLFRRRRIRWLFQLVPVAFSAWMLVVLLSR